MGCGTSNNVQVLSNRSILNNCPVIAPNRSPMDDGNHHLPLAAYITSLSAMNSRCFRRIASDLQELSDEHQYSIRPLNETESYYDWVAWMPGPSHSVYEPFRFLLDITFSGNYPIEPVRVKFRTPIFHPNISTSGKICLNILKPGDWSPILRLSHVLLCIQSLLSDPNPDDPLNIEAADLYNNSKSEYRNRAIEFTRRSCAAHHKADDETKQPFEELQRDSNGVLVDEDELVDRLTTISKRN